MVNNFENIKVFISYSSIDEEIANSFESLFNSLKIDFFLDKKEIDWGQPIDSTIGQGIESCSHLVVIVSPASAKSEWVPYEVGQARALKKIILPFLTHPKMDLPLFLANLHYSTDIADVRKYFLKLLPKDHIVAINKETETITVSDIDNDTTSRNIEDGNLDQVRIFQSRSEIPFRDYLRNAVNRIDMLLVLSTAIVETFGTDIVDAIKRSSQLRIRILALDPDSNFASARASQLGFLTRHYRDEGRKSLDAAFFLLKEFREQAEIRTYDEMPMQTLYMIDDLLILSPETFSHQSRRKCHFLLSADKGNAWEEFMFHFEAIWSRARLLAPIINNQ